MTPRHNIEANLENMRYRFNVRKLFGSFRHGQRRDWRKAKAVLFAFVLTLPFGILPLLAQTDQQKPSNPPPAKKTAQVAGSDGQQVFEQNCSRCHNPPEGFSPRISGTIALHMRVRANLSDADYKALLHFLNP